jgi:hypothetical protein
MGSVAKDVGNLLMDMGESKLDTGLKESGIKGFVDSSIDIFNPKKEQSSPEMPSYMMDTEAAKRRKRAMAMQRGLMSTTRNMGSGDDDASSLTPSLQGKQKLGQ